jgi:hypothetical protein
MPSSEKRALQRAKLERLLEEVRASRDRLEALKAHAATLTKQIKAAHPPSRRHK